jgi:hypothetical protein
MRMFRACRKPSQELALFRNFTFSRALADGAYAFLPGFDVIRTTVVASSSMPADR